eukprot:1909485-Karenia_brevis.AAC.1
MTLLDKSARCADCEPKANLQNRRFSHLHKQPFKLLLFLTTLTTHAFCIMPALKNSAGIIFAIAWARPGSACATLALTREVCMKWGLWEDLRASR